jgi:dihydroxyacetone kinase-like protein
MKRFINQPNDVVDEMLEGFLLTHGSMVRRLEGARAVVRASREPGRVAVVTGGGSGHEPAFLGYVGEGMLDAVVIGDIFTSPPATAVLATIDAIDSGEGVLLLLGNYSGDLMNFGMAAEWARQKGHLVEMAVATDDVGTGLGTSQSERRGVVGEFLVWKICGAVVAEGASLDDAKALADEVNARTRSLGVALRPCTVPMLGRPTFDLADDELEWGVGHHGERGAKTIKLKPVDDVVDGLTEEILADLPLEPGDELATVVNGLGATPLCELFIAQRRLMRNLERLGLHVRRSFVGNVFTALDMAGLSVTLLHLNEELQARLEAPALTPFFIQG